MHDFEDIWNPFESDEMVPVCCPPPKNLQDAYLRMLARKFGEHVQSDYTLGTTFLYGQKSHGSSNWHDHEEDRISREIGEKFFVPKWITKLSGAFSSHYQQEISDAYQRGKARGKSLLRRLASGDMSVLDFEDPRS